jgi:hypothetical protein
MAITATARHDRRGPEDGPNRDIRHHGYATRTWAPRVSASAQSSLEPPVSTNVKGMVMAKLLFLSAFLLVSVVPPAQAQSLEQEATIRRWFVGSSLFMLANAMPEDPPSFYQLNIGRWITPKDVVSLELITWRYTHPLGIPYGSSLGADEEAYPGFVRGTGAGLAYQRFVWRGMYSAIHATALRQDYQDPDKQSIQQGFQLFTALRLGYHVEFFDHRLFLQPSIAITYWPINTNAPAAFRTLDDKWPSYFIGEPGLHVGVKF